METKKKAFRNAVQSFEGVLRSQHRVYDGSGEVARTQDVWGAEGISGRVKFLPLAWAGMPKTSFRKNSDSPPFLDGNGRVCRLMSHAMGLQAGIGASGLWSISRGLARGLETPDEYKRMMSLADMKRQDGRGSLSLRALVDFTNWFLKLSIDQVDFMTSLFERPHLKKRLESYVKLKELKPESMYILEAVLSNGEIPRGDAVRMTGHKERSARTILSKLTDDGILSSDTPKGPVSLRFDLDSSRILFPKLFTDFTLGT